MVDFTSLKTPMVRVIALFNDEKISLAKLVGDLRAFLFLFCVVGVVGVVSNNVIELYDIILLEYTCSIHIIIIYFIGYNQASCYLAVLG